MLVPYTGVVVVPEPSTYTLVLLAAGGLALMHRRRHRRN
ncbi:MAG: PEP-CTERM sorting domain-containing protein [Chthoniobacterales bacterium]